MTVLVDTSVWIDHLRRRHRRLSELLEQGQVATHPFVVGELACGNLRKRGEILGLLQALPAAPVAHHAEALHLLESAKLSGCGLGWIDIHLLASARLAGIPLWSLDRRLAAAAGKLHVDHR